MLLTSWLTDLFRVRSLRSNRRRRTSRRSPFRIQAPHLVGQSERLEDRTLLSTFYVDNAADYVITNNQGGAGLDAGDKVTWDTAATHPAGPVANLTFGVDAFASIKDAVDAANGSSDPSDTIDVAAGTFMESDQSIILTKSITISGPNLNISPNTGSRSSEAIITTAGTDDPNGLGTVFLLNAPNLTVKIEGLEFDGTSSPVNDYYSGNSVDLEKNVFNNIGSHGMYFDHPILTVNDNRFTGGDFGSEDTIQIGADETNRASVNITNNVWSGVDTAALNLSDVTGTVSDNQFSNITYYGVLVANHTGNLSITGNTFDNVTNPLPGTVATYGAGVRFYNPLSTDPVTITGNIFENSYEGVSFRAGGDISGLPIDIHGNTFTNNTQSIYQDGAGTLDLTGGNTFDGVDSNTADLAQLFAIEDDIHHATDEAGKGFVSVRAGNVYVTQDSGSIQRGIDAATAGDTVNVAAGTFVEQVTIGKDLSLIGAGAGSTVIQAPASVVGLDPNFTNSSQEIQPILGIKNADVTVQNLTVDGLGNGSANTGFAGIGLYNAGGTIGSVHVTGIRDGGVGGVITGAQHGWGIRGLVDTGSRSLIIGNSQIDDFQKNGIDLRASGGGALNAQILDSAITGAGSTTAIAQNGIVFVGSTTGTISGNTISGIGYDGTGTESTTILMFSGSDGVAITGNTITGTAAQSADGIYLQELNGATVSGNAVTGFSQKGLYLDSSVSNVVVQNNFLTGNGTGIQADYTAANAANFSTNAAFNNDLSGNTVAVSAFNDDTMAATAGADPAFAASGNYWGTTDDNAILALTSGIVDFTPYLESGTDVGGDPTDGFQGDFSTLGVTALGAQIGTTERIQEGINLVDAGGMVDVAAGTYVEDVLVNKAGVTLQGAGPGSSIISGAIGGDGATVRIGASDITVAGFEITREGNNPADWTNPNLNSAGVAVQGQAITGLNLHDNLITGNRTGIDINNSNGHSIHNNVITNNHTGLIFRNQTDDLTVEENAITGNRTVGVLFLDASSGSNSPVQTAANSHFNNNNISDNWYGQIVDRQAGGALPAPGTTNLKDFSGNWFGTSDPIITTDNSMEPPYGAASIPVEFGGTATDPGGGPDIAGPASANFDITPLLTTGTDTDVETTPGRGTYGFQGDFSNLTVTSQLAQTQAGGRINEAIGLVTPDGMGNSTVNVGAGTYEENVLVNKTVSLLGAQHGVDARTGRPGAMESVVRGAQTGATRSTSFTVSADNAVIDGFTIQDQTNVNLSGAAVYLQPGTEGTHFLNNIVQNNVTGLFLANDNAANPAIIEQNLFRDNTQPGANSGSDIYADNYTAGETFDGALVQDNKFTNTSFVENSWALGISNVSTSNQFQDITFSGNEVDNHGRGVYFYGTNHATVSDNVITGASHYAVGIFDAGVPGAVGSADIGISGNNFTGSGTGIEVDPNIYSGPLTIENNSITGGSAGLSIAGITTLNLNDNTITGNTSGGTLADIGSVTLNTNDNENTVTIHGGSISGPSPGIVIPGNFEVLGQLQPIDYTGVADLNVNTLGGSDTVNVAADQNTFITLDGGDPIAPATPGDTLNYLSDGVNGFNFGAATITTDTKADINYSNFESTNVGGNLPINGSDDDDELIINATSADSGTFQLIRDPGGPNEDIGPVVGFAGITMLTFNGNAGDDLLQINNNFAGVFAPTDGIIYNGGDGGEDGPGDRLEILGGTAGIVQFDYTNLNDGFVSYDGTQVIAYMGLEPITSTISSTDVILNYNNAAAEGITVVDNGDGTLTADSGQGEVTTFDKPTDSLEINAGTNDSVTFQGGTAIGLGSEKLNVTAGSIAFSQSVTTTGDANLEATSADITGTGTLSANVLDAAAVTGIQLNTTVTTIDNASVSGTGDVDIQETDGVTLTNVTTANGNVTVDSAGNTIVTNVVAGGGSADIETTVGNLTIDTVQADNDATLKAASAILDGNGGGAVNVTAANLFATATTNGIVLGTDVDTITSSSGTFTRFGEENDVTLTSITSGTTGSATDSSILVTAHGDIHADSVQSQTDSDTNDIDLQAGIGGFTQTLFVGNINAGTQGDVVLTSKKGDIQDGGGVVTADDLALIADGGAGVSGTPINTAVQNLVAQVGDGTNAGGVFISNTGDLEIGNVASPIRNTDVSGIIGVSTTGGDIEINVTGGSLTVGDTIDSNSNSNTTGGGNILLDPIAIIGKTDLNINAAVLSAGGTVTVNAGNDINFNMNGKIDTEGGPAAVSLTADDDGTGGGGILMADGSLVNAHGGAIHANATDDIVLSQLISAGGHVTANSLSGSILSGLPLPPPIPMPVVQNPSFEDNVLPDGGFVGSISGWTITGGSAGTYNAGAAQYSGPQATDGSNVAYSNGGTISQILGDNLTANTSYHLSVDIGSRLDAPSPGYTVGLYAGGVLLAQVDQTDFPTVNGQFVTASLNFITGAAPAQLGQALEIRLGSVGTQTNYDNVKLTAMSTLAVTANITADTATLTANGPGGMVGTPGDALRTAVSNLEGSSDSDFTLDNQGNLTIGGTGVTSNTGSVLIHNAGSVDVTQNVTAGVDATLITLPGPGDQSLTVETGVTVSAGNNVNLQSSDNLKLVNGSTVQAGSQIHLSGDAGDMDSGGAIIDLLGTLDAAETSGNIFVTGGPDGDVITVNPGAGDTADGLSLDGKGGDDTYHVYYGLLNGGADAVSINDSGASGSDQATLEGTDVDETFNIDGQNGGTVQATTSGGYADETVNYAGSLEFLTVRGNGGPVGDTFTGSTTVGDANPGVEPSFTTTITLDGGPPGFGPGPGDAPQIRGDQIILNPLGNVLQIIGTTVFVDGNGDFQVVTQDPPNSDPGDYKGINFRNIESLPLLPLGTSSEKYDFDGPGVVTTESGYTSVVPGRLYGTGTMGSDFGWVGQAPQYSFSYSPPLSNGPLQQVLRDGVEGDAGMAGQRTFRADVADGWYLVSVQVGGVQAHDGIQISNQDNGQILLSNVGNTGGNYQTDTFAVQVKDGSLDLTFAGTGTSHWVLSGLELRPASLLTIGSPNQDPQVADGVTLSTVPIYNVTPNALVTVSGALDSDGDPDEFPNQPIEITSVDMDPNTAGIQVQADGNGVAMFTYRHPAGRGTGYFQMAEVSGDQTGLLAVDFTAPAVRRFDFNSGSSPTQDPVAGFPNGSGVDTTGYVGVLLTDTYALGTGYGWTTPPQYGFDYGAKPARKRNSARMANKVKPGLARSAWNFSGAKPIPSTSRSAIRFPLEITYKFPLTARSN